MSVVTDLLVPGATLPEWSVPLTPTVIVSTAIATRDFQDVHHDRDIAQAAGSKDVFMNILTSTAFVERYVNDWVREQTGEGAVVRGIAIRLGAPAYPYDTLTFTGSVESVEDGEVVGRAALQGPEVDGTTLLDGLDDTTASVGEIVRAEVVDTDGIDLVARPLDPS